MVPSIRNGSSATGAIAPAVISQVPTAMISSSEVAGRVARSITVFCRTKGRCQAFRKPMYSPSLARKVEAAAPPNTRTTGCPSR